MPRGLDETHGATTLRLGLWVTIVVILAAVAVGVWYVATHTARGQQTAAALAHGELPPWMLQPASYTAPKAAESNHVVEDPRAKEYAELKRLLAALQVDVEQLKRRPQSTPAPAATKPVRERAKLINLVNEAKPPDHPGKPLYTLAVWEYLPCVLENVLNSEIEGMFTVKLTRPVLDATRTQVLIPQGQRVGGRTSTADLLYGNERIPTFALSASMPDGSALELGDAPIMDASGTNGLTGDVDNNTWRIVWTSVFIRGLEGGQQALQMQMSQNGMGPIAGGLGRGGSDAATKRLGRAQDTRPVITAHSGEGCNILITKPLKLPSVQTVSR
jgi:type IV secretory pathway VirB10-like protein